MVAAGSYKTNNINTLELIYSILRELYPKNHIEISYNWNTKEYYIELTNKKYNCDPDVPVDLNIKVVYGDSVTGDTPLILKNKDNKISFKCIKDICEEWISYPEFKLLDTTVRIDKQYGVSDFEIWTAKGWSKIKKVIRHKTEKKIYRVLTNTGVVDVTEDHSLLTNDYKKVKPNTVKIGDLLLHSYPDNLTEYQDDITNINLVNTKTNNKLIVAKTFYYLRKNGYNPNIDLINDDNAICNYILFHNKKRNEKNCVIKIIELEKTDLNEYVYDIETEHGIFCAGIGDINVANTDSVFVKFKYNRDDFEKNRIDTFNLATICGENLTNNIFKRPPIEMEFEKIFQPFILLTKKRYIGKKFENIKEPFALKAIDSKGIALTRRDYCNLVKICYKEIIDTIMNNKPEKSEKKIIDESIDVFKKYIEKINNYDVSTDDLCISAMLAKEYSCANCKKKTEWTCVRCEKCKFGNTHHDENCKKCKTEISCRHAFSLAHVNLTVKLLLRNEEIQVNDRIQYIFIESNDPKKKKGELAEDPKYAVQNGLKINRLCYLEQLAKPILGLFKVVLQKYPDQLDDIVNFVNKKIVSYSGKPLKLSDFKIEE